MISAHRVYTADPSITKNLSFFSMLHAVETDKESSIAKYVSTWKS